MPHVSGKELDEEILNKLFTQLFKTLEKASDRRALKYVGSELFTRTEKIMLGKRLAIIFLLDKGVPQHVISKQLHVSLSTTAKISAKIEQGKYKTIRSIAGRPRKDLMDTIEKFILMGMPPRVGKGRWNHWGRFTP